METHCSALIFLLPPWLVLMGTGLGLVQVSTVALSSDKDLGTVGTAQDLVLGPIGTHPPMLKREP